MPEKKKESHGGPRQGAGRPKKPASALLRVRVPVDDGAEIERRGGAIWLKRIIKEALAK